MKRFDITENGYAMPLEVWVQAVAQGMKIVEVAVPLIYLDESRAFGGALDDAEYRLKHYRRVFEKTAPERAAPACRGRVFGMTPRRLRAPALGGGVLMEPPADAIAGEIAANSRQLADWDYDFQGRRAWALRAMARQEVVAASRRFLERHGLSAPSLTLDPAGQLDRPLIVTGHQPELFHPGVWIKNFAAASIARASGGVCLNLIVDNDIPKSSSIAVPTIEEGGIRLTRVEFDRWGGDAPFEDSPVLDEERFSTFGDRVRALLGESVPDPLIDKYWPLVLARRGEVATHGMRFSLARREIEASWGVANLEVPLSEVCQTDGFCWFVSHLLAQLPRYRRDHNDALNEYRAAHGIRSKNHPVAALAQEGEWLEAPFWIWRAGHPRRRPLLVRQRSRSMDLRIAGEDEVLVELPLAPEREACCAVERLRELPARAVRLRTRALTTTLFSRCLLGDLFVHGIGGAKYDELGDEIARRFFGIQPPGFLTVSMTLWLGLPADTTSPADLAAIERALRSLRFNPDRHLSEPMRDEVRSLVRAKHEAIAASVSTRRERKARRLAIRRCNDALAPWVSPAHDNLLNFRSEVRRRLRSNRIARNREFSFVLHSEEKLRKSMQQACGRVPGAPGAEMRCPVRGTSMMDDLVDYGLMGAGVRVVEPEFLWAEYPSRVADWLISHKISGGGCLFAARRVESPYNEDKTACDDTRARPLDFNKWPR